MIVGDISIEKAKRFFPQYTTLIDDLTEATYCRVQFIDGEFWLYFKTIRDGKDMMCHLITTAVDHLRV